MTYKKKEKNKKVGIHENTKDKKILVIENKIQNFLPFF